jgi:hypothetical protein
MLEAVSHGTTTLLRSQESLVSPNSSYIVTVYIATSPSSCRDPFGARDKILLFIV